MRFFPERLREPLRKNDFGKYFLSSSEDVKTVGISEARLERVEWPVVGYLPDILAPSNPFSDQFIRPK
ncbi:hypothetical protein WSS15_28170 [Acetobacter pasteurianus]|nr:hypothetical protein WSS15_28170 [Acetobacter pasteurianus]